MNEYLAKINDLDHFKVLEEHAIEIYNMKNTETQFNNILEFFPNNEFSFTPISLEIIKNIKFSFSDGKNFETHFHINKGLFMNNDNKYTNDILSEEIPWNFTSEKGKIKYREDKENQSNVLFINDFYLEKSGEPTINKCSNLYFISLNIE